MDVKSVRIIVLKKSTLKIIELILYSFIVVMLALVALNLFNIIHTSILLILFLMLAFWIVGFVFIIAVINS